MQVLEIFLENVRYNNYVGTGKKNNVQLIKVSGILNSSMQIDPVFGWKASI